MLARTQKGVFSIRLKKTDQNAEIFRRAKRIQGAMRPLQDYAQPCLCLWFLFLLQITMTLPFLLITLHLSHIGFTEGLTFIIVSPLIQVYV